MLRVFNKLVFLSLAFFMACSGDTHQMQKKFKVLQRKSPEEIKFKEWLNDTLKVLAANNLNENTGIIVKYKISDDSLQFDIYENYHFIYDKMYKKRNDRIAGLLSVLEEYREMPGPNAKLTFTVHTSYYPSTVEQLKSAFVEEVEDILVETKKNIIKYGYIRGRLSDKHVTEKKGGKIQYYGFIWHGDTLIKEKMEFR